MRRDDGDDGFVGFIPDLLEEITKQDPTLNFEIQLVLDSQYGSYKVMR